jgi:sulfotransferase
MNKQYYFLSGFFRSGNTVLSAILNQNPKIHSSPISSLVEHLWQSHLILNNFEASIVNLEDRKKSHFLTSKMIDLYYHNIDKPFIFDRSKGWINPDNIEMIKTYINLNPKIIFTTRPIIEMMASIIAIMKEDIVKEMNSSNFKQNKKIPLNDNIADFLFSDYSNFGKNIKYALYSIDNLNNDGIIHIVKYEDLVNTPQKTMNKIYDFLEIERFDHNFQNIQSFDNYNENLMGYPDNLHKIKKTILKSTIKVEDYLSPSYITKYKNVRYF